MADIHIANAPCSWGTLEFEGLTGEQVAYEQMLDELKETGYTGTELGDWGYMPTEEQALKAELQQRQLTMVGAFVPVALKHAEAHADGQAYALKVARLLAAVQTGDTAPLVILADHNGTEAVRTQSAGRVSADMGLSAAEWQIFTQGATRIAQAVREETGLRVAFHHHCAGYVETPQEIARFLDMTDPALLGLVFDTGHYLYGTGGNDSQSVTDGLDRFGARIWHMHFKDCEPNIAEQARKQGWDYFTALRHGVFCELGKGNVPFEAVNSWLRGRHYRGWIVVEQDILPTSRASDKDEAAPGLSAQPDPKASAQRNRAYLRTIGL